MARYYAEVQGNRGMASRKRSRARHMNADRSDRFETYVVGLLFIMIGVLLIAAPLVSSLMDILTLR